MFTLNVFFPVNNQGYKRMASNNNQELGCITKQFYSGKFHV